MFLHFFRRFQNHNSPQPSQVPSRLRGWVRLCLILALLLAIVYLVAPSLAQLTGHSKLEAIADRGIKITGIYYTDLEVFSEAQRSISDRLTFIPMQQSEHPPVKP